MRTRTLFTGWFVVLVGLMIGPSLDGKEALWDELGRVTWGRNLEGALAESGKSERPVFLLFQEVPGCKTCTTYGLQVLSHPLMVEAIESLFVPVLVYNNRAGSDKQLLKRFDEPAWNNPIVRYLGADGKDLLPRRAGVWSLGSTAERMVASLVAARRPVPRYLSLLDGEGRTLETATLSMHCYWDGEAHLGSVEGVFRTRTGWVGFGEVVTVDFDPRLLPFSALLRRAKVLRAAQGVFTRTDVQRQQAIAVGGLKSTPLEKEPRSAKASDQKFALRRSSLWHLPLTPAQATKVNGALRLGEDPLCWLSPRQRALTKTIEKRLASDPDSLQGWTAPADLEALRAYDERLRGHLGLREKAPAEGTAAAPGRRRFGP